MLLNASAPIIVVLQGTILWEAWHLLKQKSATFEDLERLAQYIWSAGIKNWSQQKASCSYKAGPSRLAGKGEGFSITIIVAKNIHAGDIRDRSGKV